MADETILANALHKTKIAFAGELDKLTQFTYDRKVNGTDIHAGLVVTTSGETDGKHIDLPASGEAIEGVVLDYASQAEYKENYSLGVTIADNKMARVLNPRLSNGRIKVQLVLSRSTTTGGSAALGSDTLYRNTKLYAEAASGKVTKVFPGASTAAKTFVGVAADEVDSGTADKVIGAWV